MRFQLASPIQLNAQSGQKKGGVRSALAWRGLLLALLALGLGACNAVSLSYNNAPTLLTWWADSYFDLDGEQETAVKESVRALRVWHRTQLPEYARALAEVQMRVGRPVGQPIETADVAWLFDESQKQMRRLVEHAAPDAALLAGRLRADNIAALQKKMEKKNAEFADDYINASLEKRQDKRYERVLSEAERWYGSFNREQKKTIRAMTDGLPGNYPLVLEDRRRRQAELVVILNAAIDKSAPPPEIARRLARWADFEQGRTPEFQEYAARYKAEMEKLFAGVANLASAEQRETAMKNVAGYMDEFNALAVAGN
ncbi:MAG TPA: DUF6279 family lipoprotein [Burkholderiales bacterium]|nr:DUF6279 family lipoprotein [Burkholderiales bacterium]